MMERKMKDSGIPWIGQIPEHWEVEKAKNIFCLRTSKGNDVLEHLAATQTYGMYPQRLLEGVVQVAVNTDYTQFRTVHINDYVISLRSFQGGFEISEYEGVCSPAYQVFYSKIPICHNYYKILFKCVSFIEFMNSLTVGIREGKNIQYSDFSVSSLPVPPLTEQETIAAYLDKKCGEIDELIEVEQQMISDLESYRQSVITDAVTHGLNPDAPLRDSGISWIGPVPEHWIVTKSKFYITISSGDPLSKEDITSEGDFPVYGGGEIIGFYRLSNVSKGTIIIGRVGARCGCITMVEDDSWATDNALIVKTDQNFRYFSYLLRGADLNQLNESNAQPLITATKVKEVSITIPPPAEQQEIADYLDAKCSEIDELIKVKQGKIETLKQYRQSLIFEAVTGKTTIA